MDGGFRNLGSRNANAIQRIISNKPLFSGEWDALYEMQVNLWARVFVPFPRTCCEGEDVFISFRGFVKRKKLVLFVVATWYKKVFFFSIKLRISLCF